MATGGLASDLGSGGGGTGGSGGRPSGGGGSPAASGGEGSGGSSGGTEATGGQPYMEVECPDEEPPPPERECDPYARTDDCNDGEGCYPFLDYPPGGERCGFPRFGSVCATASTGAQGDPCGGDTQVYCEPGFLCVVGSGGGPRCAQLCSTSESDCPGGLICTETDVQGFGVCF